MKRERIDKIARILSDERLEEADVVHLFTLARKLFERLPASDRARLTLLKFYSDWTLHPELDRSHEAGSLLEKAHHILRRHLMDSSNNARFSDDVTAAFSLDELKNQFNYLLKSFAPSQNLRIDRRWQEIIFWLAEIVSNCPLAIGSVSPIRTRMEATPLPRGDIVERLDIVSLPSSTMYPTAPPGQTMFCIRLTLSDTTQIITPLTAAFTSISISGTFR